MSFTRIQGTFAGLPAGWTANGVGAGTQTFTSNLVNFTAGRLVIVFIVHYSSVATQKVTGVTINGVAATQAAQKANTVNDENQVEIWYIASVTGGAHSVAVTLGGTGAPDGHYISVSAVEYSYSGTLSVVASSPTPTEANSTSPSITTQAGVASGDLTAAAFVVADSGTRTITQPSTFTPEFNQGNTAGDEAGAAVTKILSAGGAQAITWTSTGSAYQWAAVNVTFRDTVAPAGNPPLIMGTPTGLY